MIDPRSNETTGYHLFLEPEGELKRVLEQQIGSLAQKYAGPAFPPHVTLLARIEGREEQEVLMRAKELAKELAPIPLTLGDWGREPAFFKALYIRIADTDELMAAHARANEAFGMQDESYYRPHLSLYYGLPSDEMRRAMILDISYERDVSFVADCIQVYKTEGAADQWKKIDSFAL
jgi:2'-5' RNA ligase